MQNKMVDYVIYLRSDPWMEHVPGVLQELPQQSQSLNQTMYGPLRYEPIAINIDMRVPFTGETPDVPNAVWSGIGLLRLRELL